MLAQYDGSDKSKPLYLAILGEVFDVTKGADFYGPGEGYGFFSGRDGSRAFVSGEFNETGLVPDLEGFTPGQYEGVVEWNSFYHKSDKYFYVGKLVGHFWDEDGNPTAARLKVNDMVAKRDDEKKEEKAFEQTYPSCNSRWAQQTGGEVWCSEKSGGVERAWVGVPRKYVSKKGTKDEFRKCVCVQEQALGSLDPGLFEKYDKCEDLSPRCGT
mmetsp:Transcript_2308/g.3121  ORF Transcript_2308/g.3121 Transcript_2308/m.3121 type:complete len:213 (+) Transcript_2308:1-639(+)